ncbi:F390 synthetase-related protein [Dyella nitratireducens]|uniref:Coenzyme F390 synthetase n=1 Tax=Dyella nitratireducens TaxID=1849580 RepID=A0ABQ1FNI3_9GAMM|nr:F390 synthetase-related protein [Dyella nitratireducens]GGA22223.1 coenzyme F390 synthetase [Dyella nitratireducens]GLQ44138.1 coenzyme F390 synthetase [Dyella nitratireducens]
MNRLKDAIAVALHYLSARRLKRLRTREQIEAHQQHRWQMMRTRIANASPFYAAYRNLPLAQWPLMEKHEWMQHFDTINTAGITLSQAYALAERAEHTRDFRPALGDISVGLSTGTSGARGVFLASSAERHRWAATMLAKLLPEGLLARERVALLLRAGSNLYDTMHGARLQFRYIDLLQPFDTVLRQLENYAPTILVGPAQALVLVARAPRNGGARITPRRVISAAEVLDPMDRAEMERAWGIRIEQIYQATEGFLGQTCMHGAIHLNEDCIIVEHDWVDQAHRRFVPIITDLYRFTQPVIRYRLNDILVESAAPCPCGSPHIALERIEGREDDIVWLGNETNTSLVPVFADSLTRAILNADPAIQDYQIEQRDANTFAIAVEPAPDAARQQAIRLALNAFFSTLRMPMPIIMFCDMPKRELGSKRRRVRGLPALRDRKHA